MRPLIVGNWKMNTSLTEALVLVNGVKEGVMNLPDIRVVVCPPFPWLVPVAEAVYRRPAKNLFLGAQNIFWQEEGAYTGEVSPAMLQGLVSYVIIGHSERRHHFHETDAAIARKVKLAFAHGLQPILCVGELKKPTAEMMADPSDLTASQVRQPLQELEAVLDALAPAEREKLVVAYEPAWAISGGKSNSVAASGHYANKVAELLIDIAGFDIPVLYGGSVKPDNAREFLHQESIQGLLVGGASLQINSFVSICKAAV